MRYRDNCFGLKCVTFLVVYCYSAITIIVNMIIIIATIATTNNVLCNVLFATHIRSRDPQFFLSCAN